MKQLRRYGPNAFKAALLGALAWGAFAAIPPGPGGPEGPELAPDTRITGSIGGATTLETAQPSLTQAMPQPLPAPTASAAFRAALELVADGNSAEAHAAAEALDDPLERRAVQWAALQFGPGAIDLDGVLRLTDEAADFAAPALFRTRLEQAVSRPGAAVDAPRVIELFSEATPNTIDGRIALAAAYRAEGQDEAAAEIARAVWVENFLTESQERAVLDRLGPLLRRADHWDRAVHLLVHDRARATERILDRLDGAQKSLALARIAVSREADDARELIDRVDPKYRNHPLFHFSRAQLARRAGSLKGALGFLERATDPVPGAGEWWTERRLIARSALAAGDVQTAYRAAAGFGEGPEAARVEAAFHAGWIALEFLDDAEKARGHFSTMASLSTIPDSITQSHYWLGRAETALGDEAAARAAFGIAARHGTVYYGQLARAELGLAGVGLGALPDWRASEARFSAREPVRAIALFADSGRAEMAEPLLRHLAQTLTDPGELFLAARLAQQIGAHHIALAMADIAGRRGTPLEPFGFPKEAIPPAVQLADIDRAAVYAVARQESHFNIGAISPAGARGLMQLMPGTAEEVAGKLGLGYEPARLTTDVHYNALLGSTYLAEQLRRFDGSLILAAAAYNAGAGNVNKWLATNGDPREAGVDAVHWIERIPFVETRKYVQRVLGNYMVYRARLGEETPTIRQAMVRIQ